MSSVNRFPILSKNLDSAELGSQYLNKYIYRDASNTSSCNYDPVVRNIHKNFIVYMVNVQHANQEEGGEKDGNGDEKSVQSTSANNADVDKDVDSEKKQKPLKLKKIPAPNSPLNLGKKITSKSKIPVSVSKANLYEAKKEIGKCKQYRSLQNISNKKVESRTHWGVDLIKKIMGKQKSKQMDVPAESVEELYIRDCSSSNRNMKIDTIHSNKDKIMNDTLINTQNIYLDYSLVEGLREMVAIGNKIQESETRVKDMIIKYINDKTLESELVNAICGHGKILLDSERRTLNISSETWFQQAEIYKEQQKSLQNTIDTIIAQNRDLQADYDAVVKKNEKLCAKIMYLQESPEMGLPKNSKSFSNNAASLRMVEDLNKHNDRLRSRLNYLSSRIEDMEDSLRKSQKKSSYLQQQLKNNNVTLQNNKTSYDRSKSDYELEIAKLLHEIQTSNAAVKEAVEAGDVLLDDLDSMKSQFKCQAKCINWDKFKRRGKSLIDLIHLSRSCINELSKELVNKNNELNVSWQESENLKAECEEKRVTIKKLEEEKEKSQEIILSCKELEINLKNMTEKCRDIESKCATLVTQNDNHKLEIEDKNKQLRKYEEKIKSLISTIADKSEALVQLRVKSGRLEQERDSFQVQINGMTQVLSATGAGDIAKELAATQEKLSKMQAQYFSAISDKNYLTKQTEVYTTERETLICYQKSCYGQMQLLKKDIEALEKTNESLTEQLETEKKTVSALQAERVRHLEERTVLTAVYERLRSEVSKVDKLEGAVTTINQRANKLAKIAEYNKKLGKRLQHQVAEKEVAISELQNNMKELEDIHVETTKEKVALCEELAQVFNIKEVLSNKLNVEKERSAILGESKKEIEYAVNSQLKEMHGKYEREHWALKTLSKDIKSIVSQRNTLEIINKENKEKIFNLESENNRLAEEQLRLLKENDNLSEEVQRLEEINLKDNEDHKDVVSNLEEKLVIYKETIETMKVMFEPMNADRERLKEVVEYLQADSKNLRVEMNHVRESEMSYKSLLMKETHQSDSLRSDLDLTVKKFQELTELYSENKEKLLSLSDSYDELKEEFDLIMQDATRIKLILCEKFATSRESRRSSAATDTTVESVEVSDKDETIVELQERNRQLEIQNSTFTEVIETLKNQKDDLLKQQAQATEEFKRVSTSYNESLQNIVNLENEIKSFTNKGKATYGEGRMELNNVQEVVSACEMKVKRLNSEIFYLTTKLGDATKCYDDAIVCKQNLKSSQKDMACKLRNAVEMLTAEKATRQTLEAYIKELETGKEELLGEMESIMSKLALQEKTIGDMSKKITDLQNGKEALKLSLYKEQSKQDSKEIIPMTSKSTLVDFSMEDEDNEQRIESLKTQLDAKYKEISRLEDELSGLESKCALLEFQRCESILRLHEVQGKMLSEMSRNKELKQSVQSALADLCRVKDQGGDLSDACTTLCKSMQNLVVAEDALEAIKESCNEYGDEIC